MNPFERRIIREEQGQLHNFICLDRWERKKPMTQKTTDMYEAMFADVRRKLNES